MLVKHADAGAVLAFDLSPGEKERARDLRAVRPDRGAYGDVPSREAVEAAVAGMIDRQAAMLKAAVQRKRSGWTGPVDPAAMPPAPDPDEFGPTGPPNLSERSGLFGAHDRFLRLAAAAADPDEVMAFLMTTAESRRRKRLYVLADRHVDDHGERAELEEFEAVGLFCSLLKAQVLLLRRRAAA